MARKTEPSKVLARLKLSMAWKMSTQQAAGDSTQGRVTLKLDKPESTENGEREVDECLGNEESHGACGAAGDGQVAPELVEREERNRADHLNTHGTTYNVNRWGISCWQYITEILSKRLLLLIARHYLVS